ncbi:MAG: hypothetical protein R6U78_10250 [Bacteroidales bacterium]
MNTARQGFILHLLILTLLSGCSGQRVPVPVLEGESWRICHAPDPDSLNGPDPSRQHVVDHGFVKDREGTWHLWACIRGTAAGRILYGWRGESLAGSPFIESGIAARADSSWGEQVVPEEKIQAPFFMETDSGYFCFYNSNGLRLMFSGDGANYRRIPFKEGSNLLLPNSGRDVMILEDGGVFYAYSTISTVSGDGWKSGFIVVRTSSDLKTWSDYTVVSCGGIAGNGPVSAESPFVIKRKGIYYLFRSSSITGKCYVYASDDPYHFGVNDDSKLLTILPVKAPELLYHNGSWYISDLADFKGIRLHSLTWEKK